jgi:hypothetical protein
MKIRHGFVSNSSTSSFSCCLCGEEFTGWDASPSEFDCSTCVNEHIMCNKHLEKLPPPRIKGCHHEFDRDNNAFCSQCGEEAWKETDEFELDERTCPICRFEDYDPSEMAKYLERTRKISRDEAFAEIKAINKRRRVLHDDEYVTYVCKKFGLTDDLILAELRSQFGTFDKYADFICTKL